MYQKLWDFFGCKRFAPRAMAWIIWIFELPAMIFPRNSVGHLLPALHPQIQNLSVGLHPNQISWNQLIYDPRSVFEYIWKVGIETSLFCVKMKRYIGTIVDVARFNCSSIHRVVRTPSTAFCPRIWSSSEASDHLRKRELQISDLEIAGSYRAISRLRKSLSHLSTHGSCWRINAWKRKLLNLKISIWRLAAVKLFECYKYLKDAGLARPRPSIY